MLEQAWVLFIQRLLPPGIGCISVCWVLLLCTNLFVGLFLPLQLFLFKLQLQHDSTQLHVQIVSPLQFPLIVLTNIQSMPDRKNAVSIRLYQQTQSITAVNRPSCGLTYMCKYKRGLRKMAEYSEKFI